MLAVVVTVTFRAMLLHSFGASRCLGPVYYWWEWEWEDEHLESRLGPILPYLYMYMYQYHTIQQQQYQQQQHQDESKCNCNGI